MFHIPFFAFLSRYVLQKMGKMKSATIWIMMQHAKQSQSGLRWMTQPCFDKVNVKQFNDCEIILSSS